ncbi:threonine-phosphate decarboxylase CobD [uncultured Ferrovibrio sp.]|jgi:cobalamin biosynthetic protein CobC|uniref:threonine-phosphate decarboxylase CobD n=1 Tax=uncultured Ferrovibrio sp. TaxID=1576913 RepID=UPI002627B8EB|nr:threonine-phosphate decarboxylase CobD [uncultured Ferrovibrio sp.]
MGEAERGRQQAPVHGGDLSALRAVPGAYAGAWLDLSTGINPLSYPLAPIPDDAWRRLPVAADIEALLAAAREAYGCPDDSEVVAAPGTQAAIQWLPRLFSPKRVAVLGPTYAEHAYVWRQAGHEVAELSVLPDNLDGIEILIAVNPNNPDGRIIDKNVLRRRREELVAREGCLILDEAFADVAPEISMADEAGKPGLIILRSFGKFFGLAGIRLGFVLGDPRLVHALRQALGPWAVAGPAAVIGAAALRDADWQSQMRAQLGQRQRKLDAVLQEHGIPVIGGTSLFRLAEVANAAAFAAALRRQGIHVRIFEAQPRWMRFGLPGDEAEFRRRLGVVLQEYPIQR